MGTEARGGHALRPRCVTKVTAQALAISSRRSRVASAMVGGAVARPTANSEPDVRLSHSSGSSMRGPLSLALFAVCLVVTVRVEQREVGIPVVVPVSILVMHFHRVLCHKT
jgi:hypothetical protein